MKNTGGFKSQTVRVGRQDRSMCDFIWKEASLLMKGIRPTNFKPHDLNVKPSSKWRFAKVAGGSHLLCRVLPGAVSPAAVTSVILTYKHMAHWGGSMSRSVRHCVPTWSMSTSFPPARFHRRIFDLCESCLLGFKAMYAHKTGRNKSVGEMQQKTVCVLQNGLEAFL